MGADNGADNVILWFSFFPGPFWQGALRPSVETMGNQKSQPYVRWSSHSPVIQGSGCLKFLRVAGGGLEQLVDRKIHSADEPLAARFMELTSHSPEGTGCTITDST